jgi:hypothetical protein
VVIPIVVLSALVLARPGRVEAQGTMQVYVTSAEEGSDFRSKGPTTLCWI